MAQIILHPAKSRGHADHGWLKSFHSFSFGSFFDEQKIHFGALRVLNDDWVSPGMGFGTHPHKNMEIISIPLEGELEHRDSMGNIARIKAGDIQVMCAGTGVSHSEFNANGTQPVKFLQIWIFPKTQNVQPRYDQITLPPHPVSNEWIQIVSPSAGEKGVWIHQNAWFQMAYLTIDTALDYDFKGKNSGVYLFVLEGSVEIENQELQKRDAIGIWETKKVTIRSLHQETRVLLIEVPMDLPD